nr:hypothetical protein L203_06288 [Cryptococcus depauperatus CBS 7841]
MAATVIRHYRSKRDVWMASGRLFGSRAAGEGEASSLAFGGVVVEKQRTSDGAPLKTEWEAEKGLGLEMQGCGTLCAFVYCDLLAAGWKGCIRRAGCRKRCEGEAVGDNGDGSAAVRLVRLGMDVPSVDAKDGWARWREARR